MSGNPAQFWSAAATAAPVIGLANVITVGRGLRLAYDRVLNVPHGTRRAQPAFELTQWSLVAALASFGASAVVMAVALYFLSTGREVMSEGTAQWLLTASFVLLVVQPVLETVALLLTRPPPPSVEEARRIVERIASQIASQRAEPDDGGFDMAAVPKENSPPAS